MPPSTLPSTYPTGVVSRKLVANFISDNNDFFLALIDATCRKLFMGLNIYIYIFYHFDSNRDFPPTRSELVTSAIEN